VARGAAKVSSSKNAIMTTPLSLITRRSLSEGFSPLSPMSLQEVMKKDMIENETTDRLKTIWTEYHHTKATSVGLTITQDENEKIAARLRESPMFIFPVFKDDKGGNLILLSQMLEKFVMYTYLEEYKQNPQAASQWASLIIYDDFVESKGLALVRGDMSPQMVREEGDVLTRCTLHAYLDDDAYAKFVKAFNHTPDAFDFQAYFAYMQKLVQDAGTV
jgi:ATP synthase mitochondrial F1 complex assembly factor 1